MMNDKWEIRVVPQLDSTIVVEFWYVGALKFKIKGYRNGIGEILTSSGHYRGSLLPNSVNGIMVATKRPD